ncbi:MAG: SDR family oxidoreductase [Cyanobacteria bacterium J06560_6]
MTQTALITGASRGIGLALAKVFARENHNLILVARSTDELKAAQQGLSEKHNVNVVVFSHDLINPEERQQLFEKVKQQNLTVDILVNNAGFGDYGEFASSDWEKLQGMLMLNVVALSHLTHLFLPGMISRGSGKILNLGSTAAFQPGPMMAAYFASKAYVLSFSEAIAAETEGTGVTVTVLCPGPTQSNFGKVSNMDKIAAVGSLSADKFPTAKEVAEYGYQQLIQGEVVAVHGLLNKFLTFTPRITPRNVIRQGVKKFMTPKE